jgi:hypothetical protein
MSRVRDQQGRFISSSKNSPKSNSVGQSQEGKEVNQPNYLSPRTSFLAKKNPKASPQESEIVQGSLHTEDPLSEEWITKQSLWRVPISLSTFRNKGQTLEINGTQYC